LFDHSIFQIGSIQTSRPETASSASGYSPKSHSHG
jgi:hypothetical protein